MNALIFNAYLRHGGVERQIRYLVSQLHDRGHNVTVVCLAGDERDYPVDVVRISWPGFFRRSIIKVLAAPFVSHKLKAILKIRSADIVHTWGPYENWVASRAAKTLATSHVSSVRTNRPWAFKFIARWGADSQAVVANASQVIDTLEFQYLIPKDRLHLVRNAIDLDLYPYQDPRLTIRDSVTLGVIGRYSTSKNQLLMIKALPDLQERLAVNLRLRLVGASEKTPYRDLIETAIAEQGLQNLVTLEPYATDVLAVYRSIDLLVLPSISEGLPNVILEAMATGTPWVASAIADNEWLAGTDENRGLLFPSGSLDGLVAASLRALDTESERRTTRARAGREFVEKHFSPVRMTDDFETLFTQATNR